MPGTTRSRVLVTGASSGLDEDYAVQYAAQGQAPVLAARRLLHPNRRFIMQPMLALSGTTLVLFTHNALADPARPMDPHERARHTILGSAGE